MALEISEVVDVNATVLAAGADSTQQGRRGLLLTKDTTLAGGGAGKVGVYPTQAEVERAFPAGSEPRAAGSAWFGQSRHPEALVVGRWNESEVRTQIVGGTPGTVAALELITTGSFELDGNAVTGVTFDNLNSYTAIAAALQSDINGISEYSTVAVAYANGRFTITMEDTAALDSALTDHSNTGVPVATLLGLSAEAGAVVKQGGPKETAVEALGNIRQVNDSWYFLGLERDESGTATNLAVADWAQANRKAFYAGSAEPGALVANEGASVVAQLSAKQQERVQVFWSARADYLPLSAAALFSAANLEQPDSLITAKFKTAPGMAPSVLTQAQADELDRKRCNYYTAVGDFPIIQEGTTCKPGIWIDTQFWLDWVTRSIATAVYSLLRRLPRLPQTGAGITALRRAIATVMEQGVRNGGIAPGVVSEALAFAVRSVTGNEQFDGRLTRGYLIHIGRLAAQSQSDREARKAPPIKVYAKGSGAIHSADIDLTFES